MLHYILVFIVYAGFLGIVFQLKEGYRADKNVVDWKPTVIFAIVYFILLTALYEKILVTILLNAVKNHGSFMAFDMIGSGLYMILLSAGTLILGKFMLCKKPNMWTYIIFVIALIINVAIMKKVAALNYAAMVDKFGDAVFEDFYTSLSQTKRPKLSDTLLNLKWGVMIIPSVFYIGQIIRDCKKK